MILIDILDVLFDGDIHKFVGEISNNREMLDLLQMNGAAINTVVTTYTADLKNTQQGIISEKFEIGRSLKRILPEANNFESFIQDYSQNLNFNSDLATFNTRNEDTEFCLTQKYKNYIGKIHEISSDFNLQNMNMLSILTDHVHRYKPYNGLFILILFGV